MKPLAALLILILSLGFALGVAVERQHDREQYGKRVGKDFMIETLHANVNDIIYVHADRVQVKNGEITVFDRRNRVYHNPVNTYDMIVVSTFPQRTDRITPEHEHAAACMTDWEIQNRAMCDLSLIHI